MAKTTKNIQGFTLLEVVVSLSLFVIVIILVSDIYITTQRAYNENAVTAELSQNARVSLDRISRELRQSAAIVTTLPASDTDPNNPPATEILFQDGHDISQITYIRYYLNGANLMRQHKAYYFSPEPSVYVTYNSDDQAGSPPLEIVLENRIVGEYYQALNFWGANHLVNISLNLIKNQKVLDVSTSVFSRNY
ncbi:MAG: prepilin-type N-terminal cleavage/methylation domain-containing protein [Patescibacteria group bacterium]|nr:prepilin-type N-terminal cleavage/methylation domain-containing protein [Patescibacteria group bacterium]